MLRFFRLCSFGTALPPRYIIQTFFVLAVTFKDRPPGAGKRAFLLSHYFDTTPEM